MIRMERYGELTDLFKHINFIPEFTPSEAYDLSLLGERKVTDGSLMMNINNI